MVLETLTKLCVTEPEFLEKQFLPPKLEKWSKNKQKVGFFEFKENFGH